VVARRFVGSAGAASPFPDAGGAQPREIRAVVGWQAPCKWNGSGGRTDGPDNQKEKRS
jgi:hypothetical protein